MPQSSVAQISLIACPHFWLHTQGVSYTVPDSLIDSLCRPQINGDVMWYNRTDPITGQWQLEPEGMESFAWARTCPVCFWLLRCYFLSPSLRLESWLLSGFLLCAARRLPKACAFMCLDVSCVHCVAQGPSAQYPHGLYCTYFGNPGSLGFGDTTVGYDSFENILLAWLSLFHYVRGLNCRLREVAIS